MFKIIVKIINTISRSFWLKVTERTIPSNPSSEGSLFNMKDDHFFSRSMRLTVRYVFAWARAFVLFIKTWLYHKILILRFGRILGVPYWRLLLHDMAKLHPQEIFGYVGGLYTKEGDGTGLSDVERRKLLTNAFRHHCGRCTHHWEHYVQADVKVMPDDSIKEMIADWCAAQVAYGKKNPAPFSTLR